MVKREQDSVGKARTSKVGPLKKQLSSADWVLLSQTLAKVVLPESAAEDQLLQEETPEVTTKEWEDLEWPDVFHKYAQGELFKQPKQPKAQEQAGEE
eukprot:575524-Alexandrium_andersonii.AAC.1